MAVKRSNRLPFRHFSLLPIIFVLSGCLGLGERDRYGYAPPRMPQAPQAIGTISLSGSGAGSTTSTSGQTADALNTQTTGPAGQVSVGPQLEALTSEIRSLRGRFEAMEPAINRLVRVEQDMTVLIAEMEMLANEPVPFVSPENLFTRAKEAPAAPLASQPVTVQGSVPAAPQGEALPLTPETQQGGQTMPTLSLGLTPEPPKTGQDAAKSSMLIPQQQTTGSDPTGNDAANRAMTTPPKQTPTTLAREPLRLGRQSEPAIASAPAFTPTMAPAPALGPAGQPYPFTAAEGRPESRPESRPVDERTASLPPKLSCNAFGVHVGSFLLNESIVAAQVVIRERHASTLNGLYFTTAEIDLRDGRGIFHRLIAGPIGGYEQAITLCNAIESRGDYCKVTFFDPPECTSAFN